MSADPLDYPRMVQQALRGVVRRSLKSVAARGLPGDHHFYLAFVTTSPDAGLSEDLRRQYPEQMTIVLQHDFQDLEVEEEYFAVTLRFGGVPQRLRVPFTALLSFYDPAVQFALRFDPEVEGDGSSMAGERNKDDTSGRAAVRAVLAAADRLAAEKEAALQPEDEGVAPETAEGTEAPSPGPSPASEDSAATDSSSTGSADDPEAPEDDAGTHNVVSIDAFRRK